MAEWKNAYSTPSFPTLSDWLHEEAKDGRKFDHVMFATGNHLRGEITWSDGTRQEIIVGERAPSVVCVLMRRDIEDVPTS